MHVKLSRREFLEAAAMTIAATQFSTDASAKVRSGLCPLEHATTWLNSQPLTDEALQGKVVLVEFWTYSCINWRRQLPYVRAWADKYKEHGLVVVGVHSPEFSFERDIENIRWAVKDMQVDFPVAVDSDHAIVRQCCASIISHPTPKRDVASQTAPLANWLKMDHVLLGSWCN